ncbi:MAG TPA: cation:proton antiporter [Candidatus Binataceae bacterium]|nr:cation:proton antiporter [Candidatus Binataceae bacterium]
MVLVGHNFLEDLALVMCVAAIATVIFQILRQPLVVGYLVAGMIVGPHVAVPVFANVQRIQAVADLGVVLLLFSIGLEFDLRRLLRLAPTCGLITLIQVGLLFVLGYLAAHGLGWSPIESIFTGAIVSISSTTIVAKVFAEKHVDSRLRELCFGVLLAEDVMAILLLGLLTVVARDRTFAPAILMSVGGRLALFLAALLVGGGLTVPYLIRAVARMHRQETLLISALGVCFLSALLAERAGYSVALGAFLAGSLVAGSGEAKQVEHVIAPVRDMFGALFFVSVGMLIDPSLLLKFWPALLVLLAVVVAGKIVGVTLGALLIGEHPTTSLQAGFALAQIGEFAFIMAEVGHKAGATGEFLYSVAVAVSTISAFLTPFLITLSLPATRLLRQATPRPLRLGLARYGEWVSGAKHARALGAP